MNQWVKGNLPISAHRNFACAGGVRRGLVLSGLIVLCTLPRTLPRAWAQPPERGWGDVSGEAVKVAREWGGLREQTSDLQIADPAAAIARYKEFYEQRGNKSIQASVQISSLIAQLYWRQLDDRGKAIEVYQWALQQYGRYPEGARLKKEWQLLQGEAPLKIDAIDWGHLAGGFAAQGKQAPSKEVPRIVRFGLAPPGSFAPVKPVEMAPPGLAAQPGLEPVRIGDVAMAPDTVSFPALLPINPLAQAPIPAEALPNVLTVPAQSPEIRPGAWPPAIGEFRPTAPSTLPSSIKFPATALPTIPSIAGMTPAGGAPMAALDVPRVDAASMTALVVLVERLSVAALSTAAIEAAWQSSGLAAAQLWQALQTPGTFEKRTLAARPRLMGLVARHGEELLRKPEMLPESLQYLLAEYYVSVRDARAEQIYRRLLAEMKAQGPSTERSIDALWGIHQYYQAVGRKEQAADVLMTAPEYTTSLYELGNAPLSAARLYHEIGKTEKARAAYEQARQSGFSWSVGVALSDQARRLMAQGKYEEARKLLTTPVEGKYAKQIEPVKKMLLGDSYYATGDLEKARQYLREAIELNRANPIAGEGMEVIFAAAQERLENVERWIKEPIRVEPKELQIAVDETQPRDRPIIRRLRVQMYRATPLTVAVDAPGVQARLVSDDGWGNDQSDDNKEKEVIIEIAPEAVKDGLSFTLVVSSPQFEKFQARVPVKLQKTQK